MVPPRAELNVRETLVKVATKNQWKQTIQEKNREKNRNDILQMCKRYKKVNYFVLNEEKFELKTFFKELSLAHCLGFVLDEN